MKKNKNLILLIIGIVIVLILFNGANKKEAVACTSSLNGKYHCSGSNNWIYKCTTGGAFWSWTHDNSFTPVTCPNGCKDDNVHSTAADTCFTGQTCTGNSGTFQWETQSIPQYCAAARPASGGSCASFEVLKIEKCISNTCCYNGRLYNYGEARADDCEARAGCGDNCVDTYGSCGGQTTMNVQTCLGFQKPKTHTCNGVPQWSVCTWDTAGCCDAIQYTGCGPQSTTINELLNDLGDFNHWLFNFGTDTHRIVNSCGLTQKLKYQNCHGTVFGECVDTTSCFCTDSTWTPATSTVCQGTTFRQTSNCNNTRYISGTKVPSCAASSTKPCGQQYTASNAGCTSYICPDLGTQCASGTCQSNGQCSSTCIDDCSVSSLKECSGLYGWKQCGQYDSDACLDWSTYSPCGSGQTCSGAGICAGCQFNGTWTPDVSEVCAGISFGQTDNCGNQRTAIGTKPMGTPGCTTECPTGQTKCSDGTCKVSCGGSNVTSQCMSIIQQCKKGADCSTSTDNCEVSIIIWILGGAIGLLLVFKVIGGMNKQ